AVLLPGFEVAPVGQERLVERGLITRERVRGAEEVPAWADLGDRIQAELVVVDLWRLQDARHLLEQLGVEDQLLERGGQPAFEPAGTLVEQAGTAEDRAPDRHLALVRRLRVDDRRAG